MDCTSKVGEKVLDVQKWHKSRESKIKVQCSWFAGLPCSLYLTASSLHVQSASWNSTEDEE